MKAQPGQVEALNWTTDRGRATGPGSLGVLPTVALGGAAWNNGLSHHGPRAEQGLQGEVGLAGLLSGAG